MVLKLNSLINKKGRYESHKAFLSKCHRDKIIPHRLSVYIDPLTGNQGKVLLET